MERLWRYYSSYQSVRGRMGGLPAWARTILLIAALPGIAAMTSRSLAQAGSCVTRPRKPWNCP